MILTAIKAFFGSWIGISTIAGVAAIGSLWLMHRLDEARYADLQAEIAVAHAKQLATAVADQQAFDNRIILAQGAAFAAAQAALHDSQQRQEALQAALNQARKDDATLARCLSTHLPASVVRALPSANGH